MSADIRKSLPEKISHTATTGRVVGDPPVPGIHGGPDPLYDPSTTTDGVGVRVQKTPTFLSRLARDNWFWEITGICLSLGAIASIYGILVAYNQEPVPKWRHGITLNAVISILATLAKASLIMVVAATINQSKWLWYHDGAQRLHDVGLFEDASRGPSGALSLLLSRRGSFVAWFGALITVCAVGFEPFLQQLVTYPLRNVPSSTQIASMRILSGIPRATSWEPLGHAAAFNSSIKAAIFDGSLLLRTQPICPNGNCDWPRYHTIEFCSKCTDITDEMIVVGANPGQTNLSNTIEHLMLDASMNRTFTLNESQVPTSGVFRITPPRGMATNAFIQLGTWGMAPDLGFYEVPGDLLAVVNSDHTHSVVWSLNSDHPLGNNYDPYLLPNNWINQTFAGIPGPMLALGHVSVDISDDSSGIVVLKALECALTPCVREYQAKVINNVLVSDVLSTTYGYLWGQGYNGAWSAFANGTNFTISDDYMSLSSMAFWTNTYLLGNVNQSGVSLCDVLDYPAENPSCRHMNYEDTGVYDVGLAASSEEMQAIDALTNFTQTLQDVADAMTDLTRRYYNSRVLGDVLVAESFVLVRWIWLTLPLVLLFMAFIILSAAIYRTRRNEMTVWKSSIFPFLYHGHHQTVTSNESKVSVDMNTASVMEMDAKNIRVQLVRNELTGAWELKRKTPSLPSENMENEAGQAKLPTSHLLEPSIVNQRSSTGE